MAVIYYFDAADQVWKPITGGSGGGTPGPQGPKGDKGDPGLGFTFKGDYDDDAEYQVNDVVYWKPGGGTFVLTAVDGKAKREEPRAGSTYWVPMNVDGLSIEVVVQDTQPVRVRAGTVWITEN